VLDCFISGTDTGIGKTIVASAIIRALRADGVAALGMKPIASGAVMTREGLRSEDALALAAAAKAELMGGPEPLRRGGRPSDQAVLDYRDVNPYCFGPAVSPHIAAREAGVAIDLAVIRHHLERLRARSDCVIVEGAGGLLAPIDEEGQSMADLAAALSLPVLIVVGLRLGCLNHARLTLEALRARGLRYAGWIANAVDPAFERASENLLTLGRLLGEPPLERMPHAPPSDVRLVAAARAIRARLALASAAIESPPQEL